MADGWVELFSRGSVADCIVQPWERWLDWENRLATWWGASCWVSRYTATADICLQAGRVRQEGGGRPAVGEQEGKRRQDRETSRGNAEEIAKQQKVTRLPRSRTSWVWNKLLKSLLRPTFSFSSPSLLFILLSISPSLSSLPSPSQAVAADGCFFECLKSYEILLLWIGTWTTTELSSIETTVS